MRFISEDTNKGDVKDQLSLNLCTYCVGNPITFSYTSGNMPVECLNFASWLYNHNFSGRREISTYTLIMNIGNLYNGFHEIAQLNLAKHLYNLGYSPILEYPIKGVGEVDVVARGMAWEIKPITGSGLEQINRYSKEGNLLAGHEFTPIMDIPVVGKFKMGIIPSATEVVVANYFFYYQNNKGVNLEVPLVAVQKATKLRAVSATVVVGGIAFGTLAEDIITLGTGVVDDLASFLAGLSLGAAIMIP